jgi:hypothetical protein
MRVAARALVASSASLLLFFADANSAHAAPRDLLVPAGEKGTLAIDQISGMRASQIGQTAGISYAGPIGFMHNQLSEHSLDANDNTSTTVNSNSIWLAPSLDLFIIDHLSVGLLAEIMYTWSSEDIPRNPNVTETVTLPSTTSITLLPRIGYLIALGDRFALWPRLGIGWAHRETVIGNADNAVRDSFNAPVFDLDVSVLYRVNETFFLRGAPEVAFTAGGRHDQSIGGTSLGAGAGYLQVSFSLGIGVFIDVF